MSTVSWYSFAYKFPQHASVMFNYMIIGFNHLSQLSPQAKHNLQKIYTATLKYVIIFIQYFKEWYLYMMSGESLYQQPSDTVLYLLTVFSTTFFPSRTTWNSTIQYEKIAFISNRNIYALDALPLVSEIYQKTKIWPRFSTDPWHFKIPIWKQLIQYFGAYSDEPNIHCKMLNDGYSIVISPGSLNETLKNINSWQDYKINWENGYLKDINAPLVPVACIGFNDMFNSIYTIDLSPILWVFGYKNVSQTIPIIYPKSYERNYIHFGDAGNYNEEECGYLVNEGIKKMIKTREMDDKRYLLTKLGAILKQMNEWTLNRLQSTEFKDSLMAIGKWIYAKVKSLLENMEI